MKKLLVILLLFFPSNAFSIDEARVGMTEKQLSSFCNFNFTLNMESSYEELDQVVRHYSCGITRKNLSGVDENKNFRLMLENGILQHWSLDLW